MPHSQSAVDRNDGTGDVRGLVTGQEADHPGDLIRGPVTAQWDLIEQLRAPAVAENGGQVGLDEPGATTLAVIPREPNSRARERAKPTRPDLVAA